MKRALILVLLTGCNGIAVPSPAPGHPSSSGGPGPGPNPTPAPTYEPIDAARAAVPPASAVAFARAIAPMVVGRTLAAAERTKVETGGAPALRTLLEGWVEEPSFAETARDLVSVRLKSSGTTAALDGTLPGNLAAYLVRNHRPHAELVTSATCRSAAGEAIACGSGAPYEAGVLTTRVFLANNAYRFNLKRARNMLLAFACSDYPLEQELQPSLEKRVLLEMFQNDLPPENNLFGNGNACYTCHSQFGAHAQSFVKFDADGRWQADATGLQAPGAEQGVSPGRLYTSHLGDPADARSEATQFFGQRVDNLAGVARVLTAHPIYLECAVRSVMAYVLSLSSSEANAVPDEVVKEIVAEARRAEPEPTLARLVVETFSHPSMVTATRAP
jgi:hypothetical protein